MSGQARSAETRRAQSVNRIDVRKHKAVARHDAEATRYGIDTQGGGKRSLKLADDIWPI